MFTTSLTAAVLGGLLSSGSLESPKWRTNYREAALAAVDHRKPIAVFITAGVPAKLVKEGSLDAEAVKLLRENYIPLTVDTATASGKQLATAFKLTEGLVISDRAGSLQALRHSGVVTDAELKGYLKRYATTTTAATTEYRGTPAVTPTVQPISQAPRYQPPVTQAVNPAPTGLQSQYPQQPAYQPQYQQYQPQPAYQPQYQPAYQQYEQPRPVLNALQNVGGMVHNMGSNAVQMGANAVHNVGGFVQNVGGFLSGST